jgi:hypothetical protein
MSPDHNPDANPNARTSPSGSHPSNSLNNDMNSNFVLMPFEDGQPPINHIDDSLVLEGMSPPRNHNGVLTSGSASLNLPSGGELRTFESPGSDDDREFVLDSNLNVAARSPQPEDAGKKRKWQRGDRQEEDGIRGGGGDEAGDPDGNEAASGGGDSGANASILKWIIACHCDSVIPEDVSKHVHYDSRRSELMRW